MRKLSKNQVLTVPVLNIRRENRRSYYLCDLGEGEKVEVPMFPFQREEACPAEIELFVKDIKETGPVLTQNSAGLFRRFYEEGAAYTFQIEDFVPAYPKSYYRVKDSHGLIIKLTRFGERLDLRPQQYITCRINSISASKVDIELVEEKSEQQTIPFRPLCSEGRVKGWLDLVNDMLEENERFTAEQLCFVRWAVMNAEKSTLLISSPMEEYHAGRGEWIVDLVSTLDRQLNEWIQMLLKFERQDERYTEDRFYVGLLRCYRRLCIYLLEDSDVVANITDEEIRNGYQQILATAAGNARDYETAIDLLTSEKGDAALRYAESVMHKIEKSGFLLEPATRIRTLQSIFNLQPEIMDKVFPQFMWSIIGSKGIWEKEPFHSLVFGLLESYIRYNAGIIDSDGYEDGEEDNRLHLILRALALELLLATPSDDVDRLFYRSMLYRYASHVPSADSEVLLEKSLRCLLSTDYEPLEYGWAIVPMLNPAALVGVLSMRAPSPLKGTYKAFLGKKGQLIIEDGAMTLSTYESELRQRKQLSADMMPWHEMQILASGRPDGEIRPSVKEEDLNRYLSWWDYLDKCIYVFKPSVVQSRKNESEEELLDADEILDRRSLLEICRIIDRYAVLQDNLKDTYNYISFAAMLVKLAEDRWLQDNYEARRRLLLSLYRFSAKETASVENTLKEFEDINLLVNTDRVTRKLVQEVRLVTCIGNTAMNPVLWALLQESVDEEVLQLCQLVLAYNMLDGIELKQGQQEELIEKINEHLGIRITVPKTIVIGDESQYLEFKTSIVYTPSKTGKGKTDLATQTLEILRQVCGFLNAEGGTLMLGVNDYGRINGLETDLKYKEFGNNRDRYCRYVRDNIRAEMGDYAESLVTETMLEMAGHFVLALHVRPSEQPVLLRDNLWQRSGAETLNRVGEVRANFIATRSQLYSQLDDTRKFSTDWKLDVRTETPEEKQERKEIVESPVITEVKPQVTTDEDKLNEAFNSITRSNRRDYVITTSQIRQKKIQAGDVYPSYYLYLTDGEYYRTEENYDADNDDVMVTLPVFSDDIDEDAWLVLVFEDASVLRIPMSEIDGRDTWRRYKRYNDKKIFFAGIGGKQDMLVTVFKGNTSPQYRCDDITTFEEGGMQDYGQPLVTCRFQSILYCEIVPRLIINNMRPGIYNPVRTTLGITVLAVGGEPERKTLARAGVRTDFQ